jgi:hypothetical protein
MLYEVRFTDHRGEVFLVHRFEAERDEEAIDVASGLRPGVGQRYEISQDGRLVRKEVYG